MFNGINSHLFGSSNQFSGRFMPGKGHETQGSTKLLFNLICVGSM